jgi:cell division protein FtsL
MSGQDKKRILMTLVLVGLVCIVMVVLTAYAAELRVENNNLIDKNQSLQGEVETLNVKIKTANNIDHIENVARNKLGMVYPTSDECIYITSKDKANSNLATVIRKEAYN